MELGINTFFIDVKEAYDLGLKRVEIVTNSKQKTLSDAEKAYKYSMKYSIHLPVFLPDWYSAGQWDAFFCSPSEEKRDISFNLLEENLDFIKSLNSEYAITHFSGIVPPLASDQLESYPGLVEQSLSRIQALSQKYGIKILIEYFGLNKNLYSPDVWRNLLKDRSNIGLLMDTGHLYFSCINNNLNLEDALNTLGSHSSAFHIWNTKGTDHYWEYHHVAPTPIQSIEDGWAFTIPSLVQKLTSFNPSAPLIIEPNVLFGGKEYILESIKSMLEIC
ncbi:MAG: sugar phosphate isomerase/epimerase family protein [Deltaproteobacteria bacterium]